MESPWRKGIRASVDVVDCDALMSFGKIVIDPPIAMASAAITKSIFVFMDEIVLRAYSYFEACLRALP